MFNGMKIWVRLTLLASATTSLLLGVGLLGIHGMNSAYQGMETVYLDRVVPLKDLKVIADMYAVNIVDTSHKTRNGKLAWDAALRNVEDAERTIQSQWKAYLATTLVDEETKLVAEIKPLMANADKAVMQLKDILRKQDRDALAAFTADDLYPAIDPVSDGFSRLVDVQLKVAKEVYGHTENLYRFISKANLGALIGGAILAIFLSYRITRSITRPLSEAVNVARTVAAGDLTSRIEVSGRDETAQLLFALKDMNDSLCQIVGQVRQGAESIASASSQIATGNVDLSHRCEEHAGSIQETATAMEELTTAVKHNADNAQRANRLARSAADVAIKGGEAVSQVVDTMRSINASSNEIVNIISVIDGIAFQTNILALNAAVEAARAGEQGRGFAVVASEVRTLAQRSASAAKEIKALIADSVEKVGVGSSLVEQAGGTMDEILASIQSLTGIMDEITQAGREQTSEIEQINMSISQMDMVTQQNSMLVEEAAAATASLHEQADALSRVVHRFKTDAGYPRAVAMAPARSIGSAPTSAGLSFSVN